MANNTQGGAASRHWQPRVSLACSWYLGEMNMTKVKQGFESKAHVSRSIRVEGKGTPKRNHLFFIQLWVL